MNWATTSLDSHLLPQPVLIRKTSLALAGCASLKKEKFKKREKKKH